MTAPVVVVRKGLGVRWLGVVVLLGLSAAVVFDGVRRESAGSALIAVKDPPGVSVERPTTAAAVAPVVRRDAGSRRTIRVATFNIASGRGTDGEQDLARTAEAIRLAGEVEVLGLHEVRGFAWGSPGSQAEDLAGRLTRSWAFAASERRWWHEDFGNAVLLAQSGGSVLRVPLPQTQERGHRNVVVARVVVGGDRPAEAGRPLGSTVVVTVLMTHVDRRVDQPAQLRFLAELFRATPAPAVLMGDMNVTRSHPVWRELVERDGVVDATVGGPADRPGTIDLIFAKGLVRVESGEVQIGASDHPLVWAELALP